MESQKTSLDVLITAFLSLREQRPRLDVKISILRFIYTEIELAKQEGYSYGEILTTLIENGFKNTTINHFYGLLNRIRLQKGLQPSSKTNISRNVRNFRDTREVLMYDSKMPNKSMTSSTPPTLEEMKITSKTFDIDHTIFD